MPTHIHTVEIIKSGKTIGHIHIAVRWSRGPKPEVAVAGLGVDARFAPRPPRAVKRAAREHGG